ncbi:MAG: hypothetical protein U0269_04260 [Polyangiales bacterium]
MVVVPVSELRADAEGLRGLDEGQSDNHGRGRRAMGDAALTRGDWASRTKASCAIINSMNISRKWKVAVHEAAHAVLGARMGFVVEAAQIGGTYDGQVFFRNIDASTLSDSDMLELLWKRLVNSLAGPLAEGFLSGRGWGMHWPSFEPYDKEMDTSFAFRALLTYDRRSTDDLDEIKRSLQSLCARRNESHIPRSGDEKLARAYRRYEWVCLYTSLRLTCNAWTIYQVARELHGTGSLSWQTIDKLNRRR